MQGRTWCSGNKQLIPMDMGEVLEVAPGVEEVVFDGDEGVHFDISPYLNPDGDNVLSALMRGVVGSAVKITVDDAPADTYPTLSCE